MRGESAFQRLKRKLAERGFSPSSLLGQNFLVDSNLLESIARTFPLGPGERVVEIGPGPGSLTRPLLRTGAKVLAVEVDPRLAAYLAEEAAQWERGDRLRIVQMDILARGRLNPRFFEELEGFGIPPAPYTMMSNLPYSVAGPVLAELAQGPHPPARMACLVQWEMGRRLAAGPGSKEYGPLGILLQAAYEVKIQKRVSPEVFRPRPKVDSALVTFGLREASMEEGAGDGGPGKGTAFLSWEPGVREAFGRFLRRLFSQRRKVLRKGLKSLGWSGLGPSLEAMGGGLGWPEGVLDLRPEQLSVGQCLRLFGRGFLEEGLDV